MKIGIPKEIKNNENRVGMTPAGVSELVKHGHEVYVQATAGFGSGFTDEMYIGVGANILPTIEDVYRISEMIVKVKEPIKPEYGLIRNGQLVFTYFHFACSRELTEAMVKSGGVCLAYETVQLLDGSLPLLTPMSEIAGRMATINGAHYLQKTKGGKGKLICGVPGVRPAKVVVLGGGVVGQAAARVAAGMGADVVVTDISLPLLHDLSINMPANVNTVYSSTNNIITEIKDADIVYPKSWAPFAVMEERTKLVGEGRFDELKDLEKRCLANNAKFKDWTCTEELMKTTKGGKALYMHCLPADISGVSCKEGEVEDSVFSRYLDPLYKEASYKPYIIAAMIFLAKFSDPSSKLQMLLDEAKPRIR